MRFDVPYPQQTGDQVLADFGTYADGLSQEEVCERLLRYRQNVLETGNTVNPLLLFLEQFKSFIISILLFAVVFSVFIGEYVDSILIFVILLANALIGSFRN